MGEWNLYKRNDLAFLSIDSWSEAGVDMAFSTRQGGSSHGLYASCNLGLHVGDEPESVLANRRKFLECFEADLGQAVCCQQVHGDRIIAVDAGHRGLGAFRYDQSLADYDAMITNVPGVQLLTFYADCIPIYFFDPVHRAIGIAHSGWKGTMARIAVKTMQAMQLAYNSHEDELLIGIGPGIAACCFEISPELAEKAKAGFPEEHDIIINNNSSHIYWDLPETNRQMLIRAGANPDHISICKRCTACDAELFYSYRRDGGVTGRMGALIALKR